jgi:chromosome segregation ATPase
MFWGYDKKKLRCKQLANRIRDRQTASEASHKSRRQQLDTYLREIEELRCALSNQADELQRTEEEKARIAAEKTGVTQAVEVLEADLKRVKRDAEVFGRELKLLRAEKERLEIVRKEESSSAERTRKQAQAQIKLLSEQLEDQRDRLRTAEQELQRHVGLMQVSQTHPSFFLNLNSLTVMTSSCEPSS